MSKSIFIIGPSGSGKTSAARTLNPQTTFLINALGKDLPWRGSAKQYTLWNKDTNPTGNMVRTSSANAILNWMDYVNRNRPEVTDLIIDDNTFVASLELLRRTKETTWDKFNDIAQDFIDIAAKAKSLRDDLFVHIFHHTQTSGDGIIEDFNYRAMSYGKLIDEKLGTQEAQYTIVLRAAKEKTENGLQYVFYTRDANSTAKTPFGMFEPDTIPNDLALVRSTVECYYNDCSK